jgi:SAM-dependent methyltransferase
MSTMQELHQGSDDQSAWSPHIRHHPLRSRIVAQLQESVRRIADARGECRVLEVGAGHGTFTDHIVAAGASVEVTEMSPHAVTALRSRFRHNPAVRVVEDPDGSRALHGEPVDLVACVSVLHHIPDYLSAVHALAGRVRAGGGFVSFQDPMWYPRRSRLVRHLDRAVNLGARRPRGDLQQRGDSGETIPSDTVEYHVVRQGVDEWALAALLETHFDAVRLHTYWSSQGALPQAIGTLTGLPNAFGLVASARYP